jgi:prepilin-type N-terminal cleavage/methylation domain-containing protein
MLKHGNNGRKDMYINRKGFTLVELLAVIVILAIILAIAVPGIAGIINSAKKGAFESDAKMIVTGIEYRFLEAGVNGGATTPVVGSILASVADYGANPANYTVAELLSYDPITIRVSTTANSEFGAWTAVATKANVTYE